MRREETALNSLVTKCEKLLGKGAKVDWELGKILIQVRDKQLWQFRKNKDGTQRYSLFSHWAKGELGLDGFHQSRAIRIARTFKKEEVARLSSPTANAIANIKDERVRRQILSTGCHFGYVQKAIRELPPDKLYYPVGDYAANGGVFSFSRLGQFMLEKGIRLSIKIQRRGDGIDEFVVVITSKNKTSYIGRQVSISRAVHNAREQYEALENRDFGRKRRNA